MDPVPRPRSSSSSKTYPSKYTYLRRENGSGPAKGRDGPPWPACPPDGRGAPVSSPPLRRPRKLPQSRCLPPAPAAPSVANMLQDWGYSQANGPSTWAERYPQAAGSRQSPVDITTSRASPDTSLAQTPLAWSYDDNICKSIVNTGYGWKVDLYGENTQLVGGPLHGKYKLEQFHCHWGKTSAEGSEHTVDGKAYAAEMHFVHWNCEKYSSFTEAASYPDGLAVLGVFLEVSDNEHGELAKLVTLIPSIRHRGQNVSINFSIRLNQFLPRIPKYWTYLGSLTTPPCSESVIWIVFKEPINVKENQLDIFRSMTTVEEYESVESEECLLKSNYRPPLPLGNRILRECGSV